MTTEAAIIARVRQELGDFGRPFRDAFRGDGTTNEYDLSGVNIDPATLTIIKVGVDSAVPAAVVSPLPPANTLPFSGASSFSMSGVVISTAVTSTNYRLDPASGILFLPANLEDGAVITIEGTSYGMFTDTEIGSYVQTAIIQHTHGRDITIRYRDSNGFIKYDEEPMALDNLPEIEELPVVLLATVQALWALTTDASTDIDIHTAEGTSVLRSQRYSQMLNQIQLLEQRYDSICKQLNIGLNRIEMLTLRRVSRRTNRLVPVFESREYDDNSYPDRLLPAIDSRDEDESGIPSPAWQSGGWG